MPQTTYNLDRIAAVAGQPVEAENVLGRYQASELIGPGLMCELHTDGKLRVYRGGKKAGIALYRDAKEPGPWQIDDFVPILREGTIWVQLAGSAGADFTDVNFSYADTTVTDHGKATASAPSGAADAEVYDGGPCKFIGDTSSVVSGLALVECDFSSEDLTCTALAPITLAQTANDFAPAAVLNGQVYELGTTAAASTVSLPAATPDGTVAYFAADGTKNGHTLTFRDVATAISAATTASKRVAAVAIKVAGKWTVTVTVGP